MSIAEQLMPAREASKLAGFACSRSFYEFCAREKERGAPRLVRLSARKHFVYRDEFQRWLREKLGSEATA